MTFVAVKSHIFDLDLLWYWLQIRPAADVFFPLKPTQTGRLCSSQLCEAALGARGTSFIDDHSDCNVPFCSKPESACCTVSPNGEKTVRISAAAQQIGVLWAMTAGLDRRFPHGRLFVMSELNVADTAAQGETLTMWAHPAFDVDLKGDYTRTISGLLTPGLWAQAGGVDFLLTEAQYNKTHKHLPNRSSIQAQIKWQDCEDVDEIKLYIKVYVFHHVCTVSKICLEPADMNVLL